MQARPVLENEVVDEVPPELKGPPLLVERRMLYEVAPEEAVHETLICEAEAAVAVTPVGAAGGVQGEL